MMFDFLQNDTYLQPYKEEIYRRYNEYLNKLESITHKTGSVKKYSLGHLFYGVHLENDIYIFREWAPNATAIFLIGDCNHWTVDDAYKFQSIGNGNWELKVPNTVLREGQKYKLEMQWEGGTGERIPAYARCVIQDEKTKLFTAKVPTVKEYIWKNESRKPSAHPFIYEAHIGMASEDEKVASYDEFTDNILPYIQELGYDTIQLMAIQEHPYYGSFGYHVSSFYAPSSRFGSANALKRLIDTAHGLGLNVIMDIVHSHAVKNVEEGLAQYDGSLSQFFYADERRKHPAWDSLCFDYGKDEVLHFLLSNIHYWMTEFRFDGFRFDGVTSMLYKHHGLDFDFVGYNNYYDGQENIEAIIYLSLANKLIHEINPNAITIAEEMSGMPGLTSSVDCGGIGFDFRMAMGIPDFWIKTIKERTDEQWEVGHIFYELTNKRPEEKVISYAESHDQALVGDKTILFRLLDKVMYEHMQVEDENLVVDRGMVLHRLIRLITMATAQGGYLNFMGNEFGHPEWIDFPREGNQWSYKYARRQWSLVERSDLKFQYLYCFDKKVIALLQKHKTLSIPEIYKIWEQKEQQILAFLRGDLLFIFNMNPKQSFVDYKLTVPPAKYQLLLSSDEKEFGGYGLVDKSNLYVARLTDNASTNEYALQIYIPARTALVFEIRKSKSVY